MRFNPKIKLSRFDTWVLIIIVGLIVLIFVTVWTGDRVGVVIVDTSPSTTAASTTPVVVRFSQVMNRATFTRYFEIQPSVPGGFDWNGTILTFRPNQTLRPGIRYIVTLHSGAESEGGRLLLNDFSFSFSVSSPQIAYLTPADSSTPANLWIANVAEPAATRQITFSPTGITSFTVSPLGNQVAFAERSSNRQSDIKLFDLETSALVQLTNCVDSRCERPVWSPDGRFIAYEVVNFNSDLVNLQLSFSPSRVWIIDLTVNPPTSYPLFNDNQILSHSPVWSANSRWIAVFDSREPGVRVHDVAQGTADIVIPSLFGIAGSLSPDGSQLVLPETDENMNAHLNIFDLNTQEIRRISTSSDLIDENRAVWSPNAQFIAIARRNEGASELLGRGLYLVNASTLTVEPLISDQRYSNDFFAWDAASENLIVQRTLQISLDEQASETPRPEIWTYNLVTHTLNQIAINAYNAHWVP